MRIIHSILILIFLPSIGYAEAPEYPLFRDYVQYSSSVDAYSKMCVKNFQSDSAETELFDLISLLSNKTQLNNEDIERLKEKYSRINTSTLTQLRRLGLDTEKRLCKNYLKVFERFDEKRNEKLNEITELIKK